MRVKNKCKRITALVLSAGLTNNRAQPGGYDQG